MMLSPGNWEYMGVWVLVAEMAEAVAVMAMAMMAMAVVVVSVAVVAAKKVAEAASRLGPATGTAIERGARCRSSAWRPRRAAAVSDVDSDFPAA